MKRLQNERHIGVYAHWQGMEEPLYMGGLQASLLRGKEVFSFAYSPHWLATPYAQWLDPDLQLFEGPQYTNAGKPNFGLFLDSSPDRWGRMLMRRREAAMARLEQRAENPLFESDFLLGVYDGHRMGALRFKEAEGGPFLNDNVQMAAPPWATLRTLEEASLSLEKEDAVDDQQYLHWLNMLIAPGSSLGGARPKASIVAPDGSLWLAKFPSANDQTNVGAWEMVLYELACQAGISMAPCKAQKFSHRFHTFMSQRFDRTASGNRIHFASAMTLLGYVDGQEGASYLDLAAFIATHGAQPQADLEALWKRIVFNICVSNVDDHLRNHGFLLSSKGWILSPAYDLNPVAYGQGLSLNITETDNALDLELALLAAPYFRLTHAKAMQMIQEVKTVVQQWPARAQHHSISRAEQDSMKNAFRNVAS